MIRYKILQTEGASISIPKGIQAMMDKGAAATPSRADQFFIPEKSGDSIIIHFFRAGDNIDQPQYVSSVEMDKKTAKGLKDALSALPD